MDAEAFAQVATCYSPSKFFNYEDSKAIYREYPKLDGTINYVFNEGFVPVIDSVIESDNVTLFSKEQETFFRLYIDAADNFIIDGVALDGVLKQFDEFLGSYGG